LKKKKWVEIFALETLAVKWLEKVIFHFRSVKEFYGILQLFLTFLNFTLKPPEAKVIKKMTKPNLDI